MTAAQSSSVVPFSRLVLASGNPGKLREFRRLLAPLGIDVIAQAELGIEEAEEPHATFIENALAKARHAGARAKLPALADDSGICVRALGGAPGVSSARYAGEPRSDARNNAKLIAALDGIADRRAQIGGGALMGRGTPQRGLDARRQMLLEARGQVVLRIHAPAGKDIDIGQELGLAMAPTHQHLGAAMRAFPQQDDARRVDRLDEGNLLVHRASIAQGCWFCVTAAASAPSAGEGDSPSDTALL